MIIDPEQIVQASSYSAHKGRVELELEAPFPELEKKRGQRVLFAFMFCENLVIVDGVLLEYEEVGPDLDCPEQDVWSRVAVGGRSVTISF